MATLLLKLRGRVLQRFAVHKPVVFIGRDPECDLVIDNSGISRQHAAVEYRGRGVFDVFDASSRNGLFVRGLAIRRMQLRDGDEIQLGKFQIVFLAAGGAGQAELERCSAHAPPSIRAPTLDSETIDVPQPLPRSHSSPPAVVARPPTTGRYRRRVVDLSWANLVLSVAVVALGLALVLLLVRGGR